MAELTGLSVAEAAAKIAAGEISAAEYGDAWRAAAAGDELNAYLWRGGREADGGRLPVYGSWGEQGETPYGANTPAPAASGLLGGVPIAVAVGAALLRISGSDWRPAIAPGGAVCVLGALAALLILIRIIAPPGPGDTLAGAFETTLKLPIFLALAAALGIAYGGRRAMAEEGTSFADVAKKLEAPRPARKKSKRV